MSYYTTLWSIKISISVSLMRMTRRLDRAAQLAKAAFCFVCVTYIALFFASMYLCGPLTSNWNGFSGASRGFSNFWLYVALNISTDLVLVIVPFPALVLITDRRTRKAVFFVFSLAGIVIIVTTVRAIMTVMQPSNIYLTVILCNIEMAGGVVISAVPEISRRFTRMYLQSSGRTDGKGISSFRQGTANVVNFSKTKNNKMFTKQGTKHSQHPINNDIESESAIGRSDSASQQSVMGFHNTASTDQISPYSVERTSSTDKTQWEKHVLKTTTFEMKVL
jgi:hypothetical protein